MKLWFPLEMVDSACTSWFSLYEKVWSRMHEKRERTCPVYQKVPFVPPFFAEREDPPEQKILRKPRTWPSVAVSTYFAFIVSKTWQIRATSGNRVPIWTEIEVWLNDWFHDTIFHETCLVNQEIVLILEESSEYRRYFLHEYYFLWYLYS